MKFPIIEKYLIEFGIEENDLNAWFHTFKTFFIAEFESIEFYSTKSNSEEEVLSEKFFYDKSGFIKQKLCYDYKGEINWEINFERTESEIVSKTPTPFGHSREIWSFNSGGNLTKITNQNSEDYIFKYNENQDLIGVSEGFDFKWKGGYITELIDQRDNSVIKKVIERSNSETIIEYVGRLNRNVPGINSFKYDELGRLYRIESYKRKTEITYEFTGEEKRQTWISFFDNEQTSFSRRIEKPLSDERIEKVFIYQQGKNGSLYKSRIVYNKRS